MKKNKQQSKFERFDGKALPKKSLLYIYGGSSGTQSSDVYRGPSAFSEPETQIVRNFSATREFKTALNHHATSNLIPHAYNGYPAAPASGREAEYHKFCHDLTRFNRYIYGEAPDILTVANGDMSDWMLGGVLVKKY